MIDYAFSQGIARHATESLYPNLWRDLRGLWVPSAGVQGQVLRDFSNLGNTAATSGSPLWVGSSRGKTLDLVRASNQCATVTSRSSIQLTGTLTLMAWFKTGSASQAQGIIEKTGGGSLNGYVLRLTSGGKLQGATGDASAATFTASSTTVTAGTWMHAAYVYTGANNLLYLNGRLDGSAASTRNPTAGTATLFLGSVATGPVNTFNGQLDDLRLYARALTAQEVMQCAAGASPLTLAR